MGWKAFYFPLLFLLTGTYAQPPCTLITPSVLRVENEETIVVDGQGIAFEGDIVIQDFPQKKFVITQSKISVNSANKFIGTSNIKLPTKNFDKDAKKKQFVHVIVKAPSCPLEKVVLVSFQSGYIFIQSDKTIYTPGSTVLYRIYAMTNKLIPVSKNVIVEFLNPDNIIVKRETIRPSDESGIISQAHQIPNLVNLGVWTISAKFEDSPELNYTTHYEVKEYVLPSFEVKMKPFQNFFYIDDEELEVEIHAQYLYGKTVTGKAFVMFGVKDDNLKRGLPDSLTRISIVDGLGTAVLKREHITKNFPNIEELVGQSLYVMTTVMTDSGSDLVEAELEDIFLVTSPFKILFTKTTKYFKPGMPLDIMLIVTNPDGSPASRVPVVLEPGNIPGSTLEDGTTRMTLNTGADITTLEIKVKTAHTKLPDSRQASAVMTASAYKPLGGNYLHISITSLDVKLGDNIAVNFVIRNNNPAVQSQIKHFTYLILNKGQIIRIGTQEHQVGQALVTMLLSVTDQFIPSFRIVAYYTAVTNGIREIVSDSVWVDVADSCMGTLEITGDKDKDNRIHYPSSTMKLRIRADHKASVGLVAVDKGVFVLNKKFKMTQSKVWDSVEKSDIGCTPGSGANSEEVFYDAGLTLHTNFKMSTKQRSESACKVQAKRRRRSSVAFIEYKATKASNYTGMEKKCCQDGMVENLMGHSCERRTRLISEGQECVKAFLDCCQDVEKKKAVERTLKDDSTLARSAEDSEYMEESEVTSRTQFPESWLWKVEQMREKPNVNGISTKVINVILKDSITTWEVLAVSLSENKGICVAKPHEIIVMMEFFIDLKLPYSVVRNEQVEIRAILYNYGNRKLKVRVDLKYNGHFCSLSTAKKNFRQEVYLEPSSSRSVSFIIVPLDLGEHDVEVKAVGQSVSDGVVKKLKVVSEGRRITTTLKSVTLEPEVKGKDGVQEETVSTLGARNIVPNTDIDTIITLQGTPISQMVEDAIDGANLNHLIVMPRGCGEQNMMRMTPGLIATHYLDSTNQWERIGLDRRNQAIQFITTGYTQQLTYRRADNSFSANANMQGSTWLTAYVAKVFAMARSVIDINIDVICNSIKWLVLEKQKPDGLFKEDHPVYHQEMTGGNIRGSSKELDTSLTAFVLVALLDSQKICAAEHVRNLPERIELALNFILEQYPTLTKPYTIAMASYALARAGKLKDTNILMTACTDNTHWNEQGSKFLSLEASSYALLTLLYMKEFEKTGPIVRWIAEQRYYGEVFGSTQATIMMFQALAQYQIDIPTVQDLEMDVTLHIPSRKQGPISHRINLKNAMLARSETIKIPEEFVVTATGKGQGTLTVVSTYHAIMTEKERQCQNFNLSVTVKEEDAIKLPEGAKRTVSITICTRFLRSFDATMSILDVSMMTGFSPDIKDLNKLMKGVDRYISNFEINQGAAEKGTLIIYLDKVSHTEEECIKFHAHQYFEVGLIQPASVTVYDYYSPENRCTRFYHVEKASALFGKICKGDVCRCAEDNCFMQQQLEEVDAAVRLEKACAPGVDFVYKVQVNDVEHSNNYDNYAMTIKQVIKQGTDNVVLGNVRHFISHAKCQKALNLKTGLVYIIWGTSKDLWSQPSGYAYIIGRETWIEWWPTEQECQNPNNDEQCENLSLLSETLELIGCPK
ncbi:A.superbus venom factor 1-like [Pelodytes ibericus]